jgi:pimeloyl-ACP methyl ester carboxylesterase
MKDMENCLPVFLFLHGGPCLDDYLKPLFEELLSGLDVQTLFYQQHKSAPLRELVDQLRLNIESLRPRRVLLIGHSWGGTLALETIRQLDLQSVAGLMLVSAPISSQVEREFQEMLHHLGLVSPTPCDIFLSSQESVDFDAVNFVKEVLLTFDSVSYEKVKAEFLENYDLSRTLNALRIPLAVVYGDSDVRVPTRYQERCFMSIESSQKTVIRGAGHFPFLQQRHRQEFIKALMNFAQALK